MSDENATLAHDDSSYTRWWIYAVLVGILLVATLARVRLLRVTPGWYADEGTYIEIATHLMRGEQRYFAIGESTLVAARLPLFHLVLAGLFSLFGRDILTLRLLTAAYGVLNVLLLFVLGRRIWGIYVALLAATLYAIYPNAVLYSRFGFLYNQLALLYLLLFYTLWRFIRGESNWWLVGACLFVGLSLITNASSLPLVGFVVIILFFTRRSALWWALLLMASVPTLYGVWMMVQAPQAFLFDVEYIFFRVGGKWLDKIAFGVWNYKQILSWDVWFLLGAFGLTRLGPSRGSLYTQAFFWYSLLTTVAAVSAVVGLGYHYVVPLLPWVAVGVAAFVIWVFPRLLATLESLYDRLYSSLPWAQAKGQWNNWIRYQGRLWTVGLTLFLVLLSPFVAMAVQTIVIPGYTPQEVRRVTIRNIQGVEEVVAYMNHHLDPEDVVLAPPHVAWMIEAQVADFQQSVAYTGGETQNYPEDINRDRFLFDCTIENADYVLIWDGWREWAGAVMPEVGEVFEEAETWPIAYEKGVWRVFANPSGRKEAP